MAEDKLTIKVEPSNVVHEDAAVALEAEGLRGHWKYRWRVIDDQGRDVGVLAFVDRLNTEWRADDVEPGVYRVRLEATRDEGDGRDEDADDEPDFAEQRLIVQPRALGKRDRLNVDLQRHGVEFTPDLPLWEVIKLSTEAISFNNYEAFMDYLFCGAKLPEAMHANGSGGQRSKGELTARGTRWGQEKGHFKNLKAAGAPLPFPDLEAYKVLKAATAAFLELMCGVTFDKSAIPRVENLSESDRERLGLEPGNSLRGLWDKYLVSVNGDRTLPYLERVRQNLGHVRLANTPAAGELCDAILKEKFTNPCLLELIWSYWHEEGMLVQTMGAVSMRFQNRRGRADVDPLANLAIDPLRPLSNLLWGYVQDEQHRLSIARRAYEYDHEYGLTLFGRGAPRLRGADSRSKFLETFHNLLHRAAIFYKEDDDTTTIADAFPVLNAVREVHLILAEGADNQYGDLPWTARSEMLMEQWLLARPEFREFLPTRTMVAYPEPWMGRVDAMKRLQGWPDTSVRFFRDLAVFGEQILLSVRFGNWSEVFDRNQAANWARFWRQEVQWYIHAYQAVTGVDLSADMADSRQAEQAAARAQQPALHLQRRLVEQRRRARIQGPGRGRGRGRRVQPPALSGEDPLW